MRSWLSRKRRPVGAIVAAVLIVGLTAAVTHFVDRAGGPPDWVRELSQPAAKTPVAPPWSGSSSAPLAASKGIARPAYEFPAPASWDVQLGHPGATSTTTGAPPRPVVSVANDSDWAAGEVLRLQVLDQAAARRIGARGFVFT